MVYLLNTASSITTTQSTSSTFHPASAEIFMHPKVSFSLSLIPRALHFTNWPYKNQLEINTKLQDCTHFLETSTLSFFSCLFTLITGWDTFQTVPFPPSAVSGSHPVNRPKFQSLRNGWLKEFQFRPTEQCCCRAVVPILVWSNHAVRRWPNRWKYTAINLYRMLAITMCSSLESSPQTQWCTQDPVKYIPNSETLPMSPPQTSELGVPSSTVPHIYLFHSRLGSPVAGDSGKLPLLLHVAFNRSHLLVRLRTTTEIIHKHFVISNRRQLSHLPFLKYPHHSHAKSLFFFTIGMYRIRMLPPDIPSPLDLWLLHFSAYSEPDPWVLAIFSTILALLRNDPCFISSLLYRHVLAQYCPPLELSNESSHPPRVTLYHPYHLFHL